jgi:SAM-dependent methyltransferase
MLRATNAIVPARSIKRLLVGITKDWHWALENAGHDAPDGLSYPPPSLCFLVSANYDPKYFLRTGMQGAESITRILDRNGYPISRMSRILDFGCGCGRIARHWRKLHETKVYGSDLNPRLVEWARRNLRFADFAANGLHSQLAYSENSFDLVYAVSVFTHLSDTLQRWWIDELVRILRPGGLLLITVKGRDLWHELSTEELDRFQQGELVVKERETSGSNYCAAFHPDTYVRNILATGLEVLEHEPVGSKDTQQDFYLFRK